MVFVFQIAVKEAPKEGAKDEKMVTVIVRAEFANFLKPYMKDEKNIGRMVFDIESLNARFVGEFNDLQKKFDEYEKRGKEDAKKEARLVAEFVSIGARYRKRIRGIIDGYVKPSAESMEKPRSVIGKSLSHLDKAVRIGSVEDLMKFTPVGYVSTVKEIAESVLGIASGGLFILTLNKETKKLIYDAFVEEGIVASPPKKIK